MRSLLPAVMAVAAICVSSISLAQAPDSLSFQGFVTDPGGVPINHPGVSIRFRLYEGSTKVWGEVQPSVKIEDGVFNVMLGSVKPIDTLRFDRPMALRIKVGTDPELTPYTPLAAAAYAKALPGLDVVSWLLDPEYETRARQNCLQRVADPELEPSRCRRLVVDGQQRLQFRSRKRPPPGFGTEAHDDLLGALPLFIRRYGAGVEDRAAARSRGAFKLR